MRKLIATAAAVMLVGGAMAAPVAAGEEKVELCHLNAVSDLIPTLTGDPRLFYLGNLISVAPASLAAYLAHGDSATPGGGDGEYRTDSGPNPSKPMGLAAIFIAAEINGLTAWKEADCFVTVLPEV